MANQSIPSAQPYIMEESADAVRGRENSRAGTLWKIVAAIVAILFVLMLLWIGSKLAWLGAG